MKKKLLAMLLAAALAVSLLPGTAWAAEVPTPSFTDVPAHEWYAAAVDWAVEHGVTVGTTSTTFSPDDTCTHIQILTFLWRAAGEITFTPAPLTVDACYQNAVNWAYVKGMIDETFQPDAPCTRASAVKYIWQARGSKSAAPVSFTDVPAGADYADAVSWAVEKGVTKGTGDGTMFSPGDICTRAEIVTFLYRTYVPTLSLWKWK